MLIPSVSPRTGSGTRLICPSQTEGSPHRAALPLCGGRLCDEPPASPGRNPGLRELPLAPVVDEAAHGCWGDFPR